MNTLRPGIGYLDVQFLGMPEVIATAVLVGPTGVALVDPGPTTTLSNLTAGLEAAGISWRDVTALLITHIHLDHSGGCGTILRRHPHLRVYVHERGAPHLVDPAKLLASATRLYGDDMDRLWGDVLPVPEQCLTILRGGERLDTGGRTLEVAYTPGHASHHVSYFVRDAGLAFVGDTAGVRLPGGDVVPPTPPPDIDLETWRDSLARIDQWHADTLFLTHFGPVTAVQPHLSALGEGMDRAARSVLASLDREGTDESREAWFVEESRRALRQAMGERDAQRYEAAGRFDLNWRGLARYWRKKMKLPA
jgi:glyoxylase-like metal-dependent hydrolase (beta-lactamase superfamily II)